MNDKITNLTQLEEIKNSSPFLQFIFDTDNFDYNRIDLSNYMWENFARRSRFMRYFVKHKEKIIPVMKERLLRDEATEAEKKVLYGFFLKGTDVWKV